MDLCAFRELCGKGNVATKPVLCYEKLFMPGELSARVDCEISTAPYSMGCGACNLHTTVARPCEHACMSNSLQGCEKIVKTSWIVPFHVIIIILFIIIIISSIFSLTFILFIGTTRASPVSVYLGSSFKSFLLWLIFGSVQLLPANPFTCMF